MARSVFAGGGGPGCAGCGLWTWVGMYAAEAFLDRHYGKFLCICMSRTNEGYRRLWIWAEGTFRKQMIISM
jgi:hypothetical protein